MSKRSVSFVGADAPASSHSDMDDIGNVFGDDDDYVLDDDVAQDENSMTDVNVVDDPDIIDQDEPVIDDDFFTIGNEVNWDLDDDSIHRSSESRRPESFDFVLDMQFEEEKEDSTLSEEFTPPLLDREPYFERFMEAMNDYGIVKRLNNYLHKKMAEYFHKRKMEHVLTAEVSEDTLIKYGKKLDAFATLKALDEQVRTESTIELTEMRETRERQCIEADEKFKQLLIREADVGNGLISAKTGKPLPEKYIEKLISNQRNKAAELQQLRLTHIRIRNAVSEKVAAIRELDMIGDNYTLVEFEQLKIENQGHLDKIEERDDELTRLRRKCQSAIQCLAHVREKCAACEQNIRSMKLTLVRRDEEKTSVRENMNQLKQERDYYRQEAQRLKEENGLLTKDRLLIDMENALNAITTLHTANDEKRVSLDVEKARLNILKRHYDRELKRRAMMDRTRRKRGTDQDLGARKHLDPRYYNDHASAFDLNIQEVP